MIRGAGKVESAWGRFQAGKLPRGKNGGEEGDDLDGA